VRNHNVQAVGGTALKDADEGLLSLLGGRFAKGGAAQEAGAEHRPDSDRSESECSVLEKQSSRDAHGDSLN
jgi:hypothetical protein